MSRSSLIALLAWTLAAQENNSSRVVSSPQELDGFNVAPAANPLSKAIHDAAEYVGRFQLPAKAQDWPERRKQVDAAFRKSIGLSRLPERTPLSAKVLRTHDLGDYVLENVIFHSRPETPVPANIYRPKAPGSQRLPAVLSVLGHWLGDGKAAQQNQILARKLVQVGILVMTYDAIGHGERNDRGNTHHHAVIHFCRWERPSQGGWFGTAFARRTIYRAGRTSIRSESALPEIPEED